MGKDSHQAHTAPELPHEVAEQYGLHPKSEKVEGKAGLSSDDRLRSAERNQTIIDDPTTDRAVDDIMAEESDKMLEASTSDKSPKTATSKSFWQKIGHLFKCWWTNKWVRWLTIIALAVIVAVVSVIPVFRYAVLNTVGVRSSATVIVLDNTTQLPLKNVDVSIGSTSTRTDIKGVARLHDLKLGKYELEVRRLAFAPQASQVTIGWGSNPLGSYKLQAVGTRYAIVVTDFLSGKPVKGVEVESDQGNALADANGKALLTVADTAVTTVAVKIRAENYRSESAILDAATKTPLTQKLVPSAKAVFVSKQSGKYDVFSSDIDGENRKMLLAGSGLEGSNISLVTSPDSKYAMLVSQRENIRDKDGFNLYSLILLNIGEGTSTVVDRAQQIQPIDWIGDRFIYRMTVAGASAANAQRNRLISYNYRTNARIQLSTANQFTVTVGAKGMIYFSASSTDPRASLGLFRIKPDGSGRERLFDKEIWAGLRTTLNTLSLQTPDGWYEHTFGEKGVISTTSPQTFSSHLFRDNSEGNRTIWIDYRDGKGAVLLRKKDGQTKTLTSQGGATYPLYWAENHAIIFRVATSNESADYAVSPDGGVAVKVSDVAPTFGFTQGY